MFEYVVAVSLGVLAFTHLWDWIGDRLYGFALATEAMKKEDDE